MLKKYLRELEDMLHDYYKLGVDPDELSSAFGLMLMYSEKALASNRRKLFLLANDEKLNEMSKITDIETFQTLDEKLDAIQKLEEMLADYYKSNPNYRDILTYVHIIKLDLAELTLKTWKNSLSI